MKVKCFKRYLVASVLSLATAVAAPSGVMAAEVAGIKVDDRIRVANTDLVLNGSGIRYAAAGIVRVYVASLYLPQKRTTPQEIAALRGPKRVHIVLLREVNANDFSKGLMGGLRANLSQADQQRNFDSLLRVGNIFGMIPVLKKGETITIDQTPGTGTVVSVNGKRVGDPLPDEAFFNSLLQIWLGPKPIDSSLKPVLLGLEPSNDNSQRSDSNRF